MNRAFGAQSRNGISHVSTVITETIRHDFFDVIIYGKFKQLQNTLIKKLLKTRDSLSFEGKLLKKLAAYSFDWDVNNFGWANLKYSAGRN